MNRATVESLEAIASELNVQPSDPLLAGCRCSPTLLAQRSGFGRAALKTIRGTNRLFGSRPHEKACRNLPREPLQGANVAEACTAVAVS